MVREIAADTGQKAAELRTFFIKLSSRQMRYKQARQSRIAGLWVFLAMSAIMGSYSVEEPRFEGNCYKDIEHA